MNFLNFAAVSVSVFTILFTLRKGIVAEKYSFFWSLSGLIIVLLSLFPGIAAQAASWLNVINPANLIFFLSFFGLLIVIILLSLDLSRQGNQIRRLAEEIAILEQRVGDLESD